MVALYPTSRLQKIWSAHPNTLSLRLTDFVLPSLPDLRQADLVEITLECAVTNFALAAQVASTEERRGGERNDVAIWGRIRMPNGDAHPARLCNLSAGGFMAMTPVSIRKYAEIEIEIPAIGWRPAVTAWIAGDRLGCEFDPPLNPAIIERLLAFRGH